MGKIKYIIISIISVLVALSLGKQLGSPNCFAAWIGGFLGFYIGLMGVLGLFDEKNSEKHSNKNKEVSE